MNVMCVRRMIVMRVGQTVCEWDECEEDDGDDKCGTNNRLVVEQFLSHFREGKIQTEIQDAVSPTSSAGLHTNFCVKFS